jgi:hypothetical protein
MRFVSVRACFFLLVLAIGASAAAQPRQHQVRSGTSYTQFVYAEPSSDGSGNYRVSASGSFQPVENYDGRGTPAYAVSWYSYDAATGDSEFAYGYAPASAVSGQGNRVKVDFDTETMLLVWGASGRTTWAGTFTIHDTGPYSSTSATTGKQTYHSQELCAHDQQVSGSPTWATYKFEGTAGVANVPGGYPNGVPNGSHQVSRGTGWTSFDCPR